MQKHFIVQESEKDVRLSLTAAKQRMYCTVAPWLEDSWLCCVWLAKFSNRAESKFPVSLGWAKNAHMPKFLGHVERSIWVVWGLSFRLLVTQLANYDRRQTIQEEEEEEEEWPLCPECQNGWRLAKQNQSLINCSLQVGYSMRLSKPSTPLCQRRGKATQPHSLSSFCSQRRNQNLRGCHVVVFVNIIKPVNVIHLLCKQLAKVLTLSLTFSSCTSELMQEWIHVYNA